MAKQNKNNAEYFSHDSDMRNDLKIKAIRRKFGHVGYAVWCFLLEVLTDEDNFEIEYNELNKELLAADFDITVEQLELIIDYCCLLEILQISDDGKLYSEAHKKRFSKLIAERDKKSKAGKLGMGKRWNNENDDINVITDDNNVITDDNKDKSVITENNIVKYSIVNNSKVNNRISTKEREKPKRFFPPSLEEVKNYILEKNYEVDAEAFVAFYSSKDWFIGKNKMRDWRAALVTWEKRGKENGRSQKTSGAKNNINVNELWIDV